MHKVKMTGAMIALLLIIIIVVQNMGEVETKILFATITMPNSVMLGITFLIGGAAGLFTALIYSGKKDPEKKEKTIKKENE